MSFELDTYAVLSVIGRNPDIFANLREDLVRAAPALVEKQLRACKGDVNGLRAVYRVLGEDLFIGVTESLNARKVLALVRKFDKHNQALKESVTPAWAVARLHALASGAAEPLGPPPRQRKAAKRKDPDPFNTLAAKALFTHAMAPVDDRD